MVPSYSAGVFLQKRWLSFVWFWNKWPASWSLVRLQNWTIWWRHCQNPNGWDLCQMFESVCKCWHSFVWSFQTTKLPVTSGTFRKPCWYYWGIIYCWRHFCLNIITILFNTRGLVPFSWLIEMENVCFTLNWLIQICTQFHQHNSLDFVSKLFCTNPHVISL